MKNSLFQSIFLLLMFFLSVSPVHAEPKIAFDRDGYVWIVHPDGTNQKQLVKGVDSQISPDGLSIVYTVIENPKSENRHLSVIDIATGKIKNFDKVPSKNSYRGLWSPDGKKIMFNTFVDNEWRVALINKDGTGYRELNKEPLYRASWAKDGESLYGISSDTLHLIDLEGKTLKSWKLKLPDPGFYISDTPISVLPDGKRLLFDEDLTSNQNELASSICLFDTDTNSLTKLTEEGIIATHPFSIDSNTYLFVVFSEKDKSWNLYRGSIKNSSENTEILKNVNSASYAP